MDAAPLRVRSAFPDPQFEVENGAPTGYDLAVKFRHPAVWHRHEGAVLGWSIDVLATCSTITDREWPR